MTRRYSRDEVDRALEETERLSTTPHGQIVLACEVLALRERIAVLFDQLRDVRLDLEAAKSMECHCWDPWVAP